MQQVFQIVKIILPAIVVLAFYLLPYRFKNRICFGVRLTEQQLMSRAVKNITALYQVSTAVSGGILFVVNIFLQLRLAQALSDLAFFVVAAAIILFTAAFYAMAAKAVSRLAVQNEVHDGKQGLPIDTSFTEGQCCPSLWWYLLHCALIAACILVLFVSYDSLSPYISLWADFSGTAVWVAPKTPVAVALPVVVQILLTLICFFISVKIKAAPLQLKGIDAQRELERSRKRRAVWSGYVCFLAMIADLVAYAYIHFMFLVPQYKAYVPVLIYTALVVLLAVTLFLAYHTREK